MRDTSNAGVVVIAITAGLIALVLGVAFLAQALV